MILRRRHPAAGHPHEPATPCAICDIDLGPGPVGRPPRRTAHAYALTLADAMASVVSGLWDAGGRREPDGRTCAWCSNPLPGDRPRFCRPECQRAAHVIRRRELRLAARAG
jgi:hypothetical protein